MKRYWEIIADKLSKAGCKRRYGSPFQSDVLDSEGRARASYWIQGPKTFFEANPA